MVSLKCVCTQLEGGEPLKALPAVVTEPTDRSAWIHARNINTHMLHLTSSLHLKRLHLIGIIL